MKDMFYGATASIFENAKKLRSKKTNAEQKLWLELSDKRIKGFRFRCQHPISEFIVDFYCHRAKLVIEIDGNIHNDSEQADYDSGRTYELEKFGLCIIRFTNQQVQNNMNEVIQIIESYLNAKSPSGD